jgi:hexokinase
MKNILKETDEFLRTIAMHSDATDILAVTEQFMSEMDSGLMGEKSSLQMIPTYISTAGTAPDNKPVIALDAGGTNLRVSLVTFTNGTPQVTRLEKCVLPGTSHEISADEFFDELAEKILPLTEEADKIGFCFSFPSEILPNCDGRILCLSKKEVSVRNAEGIIIGEKLLEKLREKGVTKNFKVTILNDTVASLMGGIATLKLSDYDGFAGLILGTGNNACYAEKAEKIVKLSDARDMIINCETGSFSKAFRGLSDEIMDVVSDNPGEYLFEKMLSGAYHGKVITNTAELASKSGLLSENFAGITPPFSTPELDDFLRGKDNRAAKMCIGTDAEVLREIIDNSFERAAKLVCANIAAICLHCDGGKSAERPFCVIAEGSTFYNSLLFKEKFDKHVKSFIEGRLSRHVVFFRGENVTLSGAAYSALLN